MFSDMQFVGLVLRVWASKVRNLHLNGLISNV